MMHACSNYVGGLDYNIDIARYNIINDNKQISGMSPVSIKVSWANYVNTRIN